MIQPIVLHKVNQQGVVYCLAMCFEGELVRLQEEGHFVEEQQTHESLFKLLYPIAYIEYLRKNLPDCVGLWIEELYSNKKDYTIDDNCVFSDSFMICAVHPQLINLTFYIGCSAIESAKLTQFLMSKLEGTGVDVEVREITEFAFFSDN